MDRSKKLISGWETENFEQLSVKQLFLVMFFTGGLSIGVGVLFS